MDWATALGLGMGIIATADLAYKYGSALFKKVSRATTLISKQIITKRSRPSAYEGTSFATPIIAHRLAAIIEPRYYADITAYQYGSRNSKKKPKVGEYRHPATVSDTGRHFREISFLMPKAELTYHKTWIQNSSL